MVSRVVRRPGTAAKPAPKAKAEEEFFGDDDEDAFEEPRKPTASRRGRDEEPDDDDDEDTAAWKPKRGWGAYAENKAEGSDYANELKLGETPQVVVFLENEPLVSFRQHWIERKGKRSFICMGKDCPLCAIGDRARTINYFNLVLLSAEGDPVNMIVVAGVQLSDQLHTHSVSERTGPLVKGYWAISRSGTTQRTNYGLDRVKERDLVEDWGITPLTAAEHKALVKKAYTPETALKRPTKRELSDIVAEIVGDEV